MRVWGGIVERVSEEGIERDHVAGDRPRVVLFRANRIDTDTRAKKWALTLDRLGYEVIVLDPISESDDATERRLGGVRVLPVVVGTRHRDEVRDELVGRRNRTIPILSRKDAAAYKRHMKDIAARRDAAQKRAASAKKKSRGTVAGKVRQAVPFAAARSKAVARAAQLRVASARQNGQTALNARTKKAWKSWTTWSRSKTAFASVRGMLPEVLDYTDAYVPVLVELQPDILHAHHPFVLPAAAETARQLQASGIQTRVLYDARENFAGIPEEEQGNRRRHHVLLGLEAENIRSFDAVVTVSEPIADALRDRYSLPTRPSVILNVPPWSATAITGSVTLREVLELGPDVPLLVYSGAVSRARGIEDLMAAMPLMPSDVHLAMVTVPFPHPMTPALLEQAGAAADRVHPIPPVSQQELLCYLSGADVGVHPMPGGSPNHEMALPNKLFEYLHAELTLAVSDAKSMSEFVLSNQVGEVFAAHDPADLARAVTTALARRSESNSASRQQLAQRYSWQAQEGSIAELYGRMAPVPHRDLSAVFPSLEVNELAGQGEA